MCSEDIISGYERDADVDGPQKDNTYIMMHIL